MTGSRDPDRTAGCLLGLALGDALGAPYEGGIVERFAWKLIGKTRAGERRWTDDTQMALDVAESLVAQDGLDLDELARRFAASYRWSRGYGPGAAKLLKRIAAGEDWRTANRAIFPDGSFGNGGAMRAPVLALFFAEGSDELVEAARTSASVTHAHPLGVEGAVLIAVATSLALHEAPAQGILETAASNCSEEAFTTRLEVAAGWLRGDDTPDAGEVRRRLGNGIAASESCVTALYIALRFLDQPFEEMLRFVISGGGDVDTIGAMAGAMWGARRGRSLLPVEPLQRLEQRARLEAAAEALLRARIRTTGRGVMTPKRRA